MRVHYGNPVVQSFASFRSFSLLLPWKSGWILTQKHTCWIKHRWRRRGRKRGDRKERVRTVDAYDVAVFCPEHFGCSCVNVAGVVSLRHRLAHFLRGFISWSSSDGVNVLAVVCEGDVSLQKEAVYIILHQHQDPIKRCYRGLNRLSYIVIYRRLKNTSEGHGLFGPDVHTWGSVTWGQGKCRRRDSVW